MREQVIDANPVSVTVAPVVVVEYLFDFNELITHSSPLYFIRGSLSFLLIASKSCRITSTTGMMT